MRNRNKLASVSLCGVIVLGAGYALAADWPQWRGPNRDAKVSGFVVPQTWPQQLTQKWKIKAGPSDATPALVGDRLYVFSRQGDDEVLACLDAAKGNTLWENKHAPGVKVGGPAGSHPGPRSSPTVAEGKVVTLGVSGVLTCLDAEKGGLVWRKDSAKDFPKGWPMFYTASSPIIVDGRCIAQLGGPGKGAVVAFDLATGDVKWKTDGDGPAYASPVIMTAAGVKQIVAQTDKSLIGLALADGALLWQIPAVPERRSQNAVTPVIDGDVVIFTGQGKGTRAVKIEKKGDGFAATDVWANEQIGDNFNTPVLKDGLLYGLSDKGYLYCLNAKNGKTLWTDTTPRGERGFGSIVDAGSVLIALTNKAELVAFKPSDKGYSELATIKLGGGATYAYPVLAGNRIFIEDQDSVAAYAIE
jgi:outer membrane protein assembly factor BamB